MSLLMSCSHRPNTSYTKDVKEISRYSYREVSPLEKEDSTLIILAFSGGGTRAAAFSYGLLKGLNDVSYPQKDSSEDLLDQVDLISSISGGSFTAAYYGLFREETFSTFKERMLYKNIQGGLVWRILNPLNWFRLASSDFDRIDIAAEMYDKKVFKHKTYADLIKQPKPFILLNATDMSLGRRFEFNQNQFDFLCADLSHFKIAQSVAASSAFPFLLSPLSLNNYAQKGCQFKTPQWILSGLKQKNNSRRKLKAQGANTYLTNKDYQYVKLMDGGLSDNIGLRGPLNALKTTDSPWSVLQLINQGRIKRVLVIVVNAKTENGNKWYKKKKSPGITSVAGFTATNALNDYSFDTVELLKSFFRDYKTQSATRNYVLKKVRGYDSSFTLPNLPNPKLNVVEIAFDQLPKEKEHLKGCLEALPTNFNLSKERVDLLIESAQYLLFQSKEFNRFMKATDKNWKKNPFEIQAPLVKAACD